MYVYLYDSFVRDRAQAREISAIEHKLTDFGIAGKVLRITSFTNPRIIVEDEVRRGATTVVLVGNDETLGRVLSRAADIDTTFGFIPIGSKNALAPVLGIPVGVGAAEVLSRRRVEKIDVGIVNGRFFLFRISIPPAQVVVECEGRFVVASERERVSVEVCNLLGPSWKGNVLHPQDGLLETYLRPAGGVGRMFRKAIPGDESVFSVRQLVVRSREAIPVFVDDRPSRETKLEISIARKRVKMITGKGRKF